MQHQSFWEQFPALLIGISFLTGIGITLFGIPFWLGGLWALYVLYLRKWQALCLICFGVLYAWGRFGNCPELEYPLSCKAHFSIHSLQSRNSPFRQELIYKGILYFENHALPCSFIWKNKQRPLATSDYQLRGILSQRGPYDYLFKVQEYAPISNTWSLAELRYTTKEKVKQFFKKKLERPRSALFLSSLATGDVENRILRFEFGRLGLQHLLAISGFHFGILLAFLSFLLGLFLKNRLKWTLMLILVSIYFFFIGSSPAVQRAYVMASLFLIGNILRRPANSLNLLGAAAFLELCLNPLSAANLGFQLSFGCCFGILLLYRPLERFFCRFFPQRPTKKSIHLALLSKMIFILSSAFRNALSLTFAVNAAILPLLFFHFGRFPMLSLLYNLFFPFLVSIALFGLLLSLLLFLLIPPIAPFLFLLLDRFTDEILNLTTYPPLALDYSLYCPEFPPFFVFLYLFLLFSVSLYFLKDEEQINYFF